MRSASPYQLARLRLASAMALAAALAWSTAAGAQWLPGPQFAEPQVVVGDPVHVEESAPLEALSTDPETAGIEPADAWALPQDLPQPLDQDAIAAIHAQAAAAVVPVRAVFERDPLLWPPVIEVEGVATRVSVPGQPVLYLTALALVEGATRVEMAWEGRTVAARVRGDARFGLALLEPVEPLGPAASLSVHTVTADQPVEAFSAGPYTSGSTLGAGPGVYAWYQLNTLGVTMGYPLVNRRGELVGVGSHRYPLEPALTLSVPSAAVEAFLAEAAAPE